MENWTLPKSQTLMCQKKLWWWSKWHTLGVFELVEESPTRIAWFWGRKFRSLFGPKSSQSAGKKLQKSNQLQNHNSWSQKILPKNQLQRIAPSLTNPTTPIVCGFCLYLRLILDKMYPEPNCLIAFGSHSWVDPGFPGSEGTHGCPPTVQWVVSLWSSMTGRFCLSGDSHSHCNIRSIPVFCRPQLLVHGDAGGFLHWHQQGFERWTLQDKCKGRRNFFIDEMREEQIRVRNLVLHMYNREQMGIDRSIGARQYHIWGNGCVLC